MAYWQRHLQLVIRQVSKRVKINNNISTANYYSSARNLESHFSQGYLQGLLRPTYSSGPLYHHLQQLGICTSRILQAGEEAVSSPLSSPALLGSGKEEEQKIIPKRKIVQAVLKAIKQSPKKVNLVAALVRGMRVEDALMQLQVTVKRASQTVYRVVHAARANASHNHGLDPDRLLIAEAFVGKGLFKKRISYHGKGKCGLMVRPECRLTVIVREMTPEEEALIARLKVHNFKKLSKREKRLVPHKLIETTPIWNRKGTKENYRSSELVPSH
ncbi:Large ribosomal subunit protein uL22c [Cardamine amara subsp. amara]|uniref:Large ribosomal subunit protein uL22c n=1 Tax=Cardamine amara subsp. amara TaxID=228776 RepID=A0ABD1B952_CARAN